MTPAEIQSYTLQMLKQDIENRFDDVEQLIRDETVELKKVITHQHEMIRTLISLMDGTEANELQDRIDELISMNTD